jgi:hypothetical protein
MNLLAIQRELAARLGGVVAQVYETPPAQPVFPCAVVKFPTVEAFHIDWARQFARVTVEIDVIAGRGDSTDAAYQLADFMSTDTKTSVVVALEDTPWSDDDTKAWQTISVSGAGQFRNEGDGLAVTFSVSIEA